MFKSPRPLKDPSSESHGYDYALFLLSLRMRTEGEIRAKMQTRGYTSEVIEEVVARLYDLNYLDDRQFAEMFLESMKKYKTYGQFFIKQKMYMKKLPKKLVEKVLQQNLSLDDEISIAERFIKKDHPEFFSDKEKFSYDEKQQMAQRLKGRGFSGQVVSKIVFD